MKLLRREPQLQRQIIRFQPTGWLLSMSIAVVVATEGMTKLFRKLSGDPKNTNTVTKTGTASCPARETPDQLQQHHWCLGESA
ncbi:hypothetical protein BJX76DRAFT_320958 [Aspergillus varians]